MLHSVASHLGVHCYVPQKESLLYFEIIHDNGLFGDYKNRVCPFVLNKVLFVHFSKLSTLLKFITFFSRIVIHI